MCQTTLPTPANSTLEYRSERRAVSAADNFTILDNLSRATPVYLYMTTQPTDQ
jgi:hypothetical protein